MKTRRRLKQIETFKERLMSFAKDARIRAEQLPPGSAKNDMLSKAGQADTASHIDAWLSSPGLRPPK